MKSQWNVGKKFKSKNTYTQGGFGFTWLKKKNQL
jgi:hypothetical protein